MVSEKNASRIEKCVFFLYNKTKTLAKTNEFIKTLNDPDRVSDLNLKWKYDVLNL